MASGQTWFFHWYPEKIVKESRGKVKNILDREKRKYQSHAPAEILFFIQK
jgi:hypothetical protein